MYTLSKIYNISTYVCNQEVRRAVVVDFAAGPAHVVYEKSTLLGMTFINLTFSFTAVIRCSAYFSFFLLFPLQFK